MPSISVICYTGYLKIIGMGSITGAYSTWGNVVVMPWKGLWQLVHRTFTLNLNFIDAIEIPFFLLSVSAILIGLRILPFSYSLYNLVMLSFILMIGKESSFLSGSMRYLLIIFPIFMVLGKIIKNRNLLYAIISVSLCLNLLLTWLFVNWFWVA